MYAPGGARRPARDEEEGSNSNSALSTILEEGSGDEDNREGRSHQAEVSTASARISPEPVVTEETPLLELSESEGNARNYDTMNTISLLPPCEMSKSLDGYLEPFVNQRLNPPQGTFEGLDGISSGKRRLGPQVTLQDYHRALVEHHALVLKPRLLTRRKSDSELLSHARSRNLIALLMGLQAVEPQDTKSVGIHTGGEASIKRIEGAASSSQSLVFTA